MSEQTLTLTPKTHDKLGPVHCGVPSDGFIAVGGYPRSIDDGEEVVFERVKVKAKRSGDEYFFMPLS
jgi:hypothetical protein